MVAREYRYYVTLKVARDATPEQIKAAFRRRAKECHPDTNPGNPEAEARFRELSKAYQVLSDPLERAQYDRSEAECPKCGTYKLLDVGKSTWECRLCGCQFHARGLIKNELVLIAGKNQGLDAKFFEGFQATRCSWCVRFYSRPRSCPHDGLRNQCVSFHRMSGTERTKELLNDYWRTRAIEYTQKENSSRRLRQCADTDKCGALCPSSALDRSRCSLCGNPLNWKCPNCGADLLYFDLSVEALRCPNNQCSGHRWRFEAGSGIRTASKSPRTASSSSKAAAGGRTHTSYKSDAKRPRQRPSCLNCGNELVFSTNRNLWSCPHCRHYYTKAQVKMQPGDVGSSTQQDAPQNSRQNHAGGRRLQKGLIITIICVLLLIAVLLLIETIKS